MRSPRSTAAFSLVEVAVAVGIFAVSVAVIIGLLPTLTRQTSDAAEARVAQGMPDLVTAEIQRLAGTSLDSFGNLVPVMSAPLQTGYGFVANRDGSRLHSVASPPATTQVLPVADQFYRIEVWRFPSSPLAFSSTSAVLALYVRVSWPYYNPGATTPTPLEARSQFTFTVALNR